MPANDFASSPPAKNVLVIGAGPAGLAAGIALRKAGVEQVTIVDRDSADAVLGSELHLQSAALRALESIGVAEACVAVGAPLAFARYLTADGSLIGESHDVEILTREKLPPRLGISRPALHRALSGAARDRGCILHHERRLTGIEAREDSVVAMFEDGTSSVHDLLIGADGVYSTVRSLAFPDAPEPEYVGQVAWRARVPLIGTPRMEIYLGAQNKVGIIAVNETEAYLFHLEPEPDYQWIERDDMPAILREKLAGYGGGVAEVREHIQDPAMVHYSPLSPLLMAPPWHSGRILLIGDAVHATTPHLAYGAGLAMEDGVVLGEEMARTDDLDTALAAFAARRWDRCKLVVESGAQIAKWEIEPDTPGADALGLTISMQVKLAEEI